MNHLRKRSLIRKILYSLGGVILVLAVSAWVFYTYYLEDTVNDFLAPKLLQVVSAATDGKYSLRVGRIFRKDGDLYCTNFDLRRIKYDSGESGITLTRLFDDTVKLTGIEVSALFRGHGSFMKSLEMRSPMITIGEVPEWNGAK
ncbi:MAG: hypothetical protein ABI778_05780, partial [Ignavibacteriota bacterium]